MEELRLIGQSPAHLELVDRLRKVASTDAEVLITGPSGTGKELYARFLHRESRRRCGGFVPVNCGALPSDLLENELFGHVGGAFTGASPQNEGLVAQAERGTLFLDEVDSLAPLNQVKLLRFIQEKEYRRLGDPRLRKADVRLVAATNADLLGLVREGQFREDLFFRLRVVPLQVPPLRERPGDVALLVDAYAQVYAREYAAPALVISPRAQATLESYSWPGNVRELENCVRCLICMQLGRPVEPPDLQLLDKPSLETPAGEPARLQEAKRAAVARFERTWLVDALRRTNGNITRAAKESGKDRRAFFELMRKHGVKAQPER